MMCALHGNNNDFLWVTFFLRHSVWSNDTDVSAIVVIAADAVVWYCVCVAL